MTATRMAGISNQTGRGIDFRPLTYRRSRLWYLTPDSARPFPQVPATAFVAATLPAVPVASAVRQPSACVLQQGNLRCPRPWPGVRKTGLDITAQEGSG